MLKRFSTFASLSLSFLALAALMAGCNYKTSKVGDGANGATEKFAGTVPSYSELASSILAGKCFTCHDGGRQTDLRSFAAFSSEAGSIKAHITESGSGHMPPAGSPQLTSQESAAILTWIASGTPENGASADSGSTASGPAKPTAPVPSFVEMKVAFLDSKCLTCHHAGSPIGDFTTYDLITKDLGAVRLHVLLPQTTRGHMPPTSAARPHPQLTAFELTTLVAWIDAGAPENGQGEDQVVSGGNDASSSPTPSPTPAAEPTPAPTAPPTPSPAPTPAPSATPLPTPVATAVPVMSWSQLSSAIVQPKCATCHDGNDEEDLSTYSAFAADVTKIADRISRPVTQRGHMPPTRGPQLTDDEKKAILAWINNGAKE